MEALCLKTFWACWFLNKDWLVSFIVLAQCLKPDVPITWVEFIPKGHMHLVCCALKLIPPTHSLPLAKVKECMFSFILKVLNGPGSLPGFFNACKAAKPRKRTHKHEGKGNQSTDIAVDTPKPCIAVQSSSQEPEAPTPLGADNSNPPPLEGSSKPSAFTQHFPSPSSEDPRASQSLTPLPSEPEPPAPVVALTLSAHVHKLLQAREKMDAQMERWAASQSPSLAPLIASVLGKHPPLSTTPSLSPLPALGSPIALAVLDWRTWMQYKQANYLHNNPGKSTPVMVTLLDLRDAASAATTASPFSPLSALSSNQLRSPSPLSLPSQMSPESKERTPTLHAVGCPS